MRLDDAAAIVDDYARLMRSQMELTQQGNTVCVVTPMLNRNNDCMNIYLADAPDGGIIVTDLGETISDLEFSGFSFTGQREGKLLGLLAGYGASIENGELVARGTRSEIPDKMNMLMQAMASVDDMFLLSQSSVRNLFAEDVGNWLLENDIRAVEGPSFTGRSGMSFKFDYAIGRSKRSPMRVIKTVNNPGRQGIQNALFGWEDVKSQRSECDGYVFLNSKNTKDGRVPEETITACRNYGLFPVVWGVDENSYIEALAA